MRTGEVEVTPKVSRQREWQRAKVKAGLCMLCGRQRKKHAYRCDKCQKRHNKRQRERGKANA
jgi:hypothetical protein